MATTLKDLSAAQILKEIDTLGVPGFCSKYGTEPGDVRCMIRNLRRQVEGLGPNPGILCDAEDATNA